MGPSSATPPAMVPGAGAGGCCSRAPAGPTLFLVTKAEAPAVLSQCLVAAGSDPGAEAREESASICHHERVAKLSPKMKMGLRDSPNRAGLEPLATVLEVSVLPPLGVSQICAPRVVTPAGACLGGNPWEFWLSAAAGTKAGAASTADRLGASTLACKSCSDISGWSHPHVGLFGGDRKEL